ncbi:MAG: histidine phosphatase family protein, partial [Lachnospiraceae bacterium]|nr:histidine phosphatase family protein [Lachnospiraceae bacterium]
CCFITPSVPFAERQNIMMQLCQRVYNLIDDIRADDRTYLLVAHNGISRVVQSYFYDMTNEEFAAFGIGNCEVRTYTW